MTTFALVHGAWHGAWTWDLLKPLLEAKGHRAVAMDLPCEDHDATFFDYASVVSEHLGDADDVVVVGHSLGGMTIPLVALRRPVRLMVFLNAGVPERAGPKASGAPPFLVPGALDRLARHDDGSNSWRTLEDATKILYQDCPPDLAAAAYRRLRRQQFAMLDRSSPLERWPDARAVYILGTDDRAINPEWSRWVARTRLGVEPIELPGGHSPMLARPQVLADALIAALAEPSPAR